MKLDAHDLIALVADEFEVDLSGGAGRIVTVGDLCAAVAARARPRPAARAASRTALYRVSRTLRAVRPSTPTASLLAGRRDRAWAALQDRLGVALPPLELDDGARDALAALTFVGGAVVVLALGLGAWMSEVGVGLVVALFGTPFLLLAAMGWAVVRLTTRLHLTAVPEACVTVGKLARHVAAAEGFAGESTAALVRATVAERLGVDRARVKPNARLAQVLDAG